MPIALELGRRGHDVTVVCEPPSQPTFTALGFAFRPAVELERRMAAFDPASHGGGRPAKFAWHAEYVRGLFADTAGARGRRFRRRHGGPARARRGVRGRGRGCPVVFVRALADGRVGRRHPVPAPLLGRRKRARPRVRRLVERAAIAGRGSGPSVARCTSIAGTGAPRPSLSFSVSPSSCTRAETCRSTSAASGRHGSCRRRRRRRRRGSRSSEASGRPCSRRSRPSGRATGSC
jgi:hypothetical protein